MMLSTKARDRSLIYLDPSRPSPNRQTPVSLTQKAFVDLFEKFGVPPAYIEALVNNNGIHVAFTTFTQDGRAPEIFRA